MSELKSIITMARSYGELEALLDAAKAEIERLRNEPKWQPDMDGLQIWNGADQLTATGQTVRISSKTTMNVASFDLPQGYALCVLVDPADPMLRKNQVHP